VALKAAVGTEVDIGASAVVAVGNAVVEVEASVQVGDGMFGSGLIASAVADMRVAVGETVASVGASGVSVAAATGGVGVEVNIGCSAADVGVGGTGVGYGCSDTDVGVGGTGVG